MISKFMKAMHRLHKGQRGMTGLETAIILIAFVTVAAVFGYAVLSAGIFSAEKGKESVYAGLEQAKSSMELKGSVIAYGAPGTEGTINDCDVVTGWDTNAGTGVTVTQTVGYGSGYSVQFTLEDGFTAAGVVSYDASAIADLSEKTFVNLYIMTDTDMAAGDLKLLLSLGVPDGATDEEIIDLPAITEGSWTLVTLSLANPEDDTTIANVGLYYNKAIGTGESIIVYTDSIVSGPPYNHAELIAFTMANAIAGNAIDLTPTPNNVTVISYADNNIYEPNINWTVSFIGQNDGDYLLEMGEQAQIQVALGFLATPPGANDELSMQVKPPQGSVVTIERTIPANIDAVMDLY